MAILAGGRLGLMLILILILVQRGNYLTCRWAHITRQRVVKSRKGTRSWPAAFVSQGLMDSSELVRILNIVGDKSRPGCPPLTSQKIKKLFLAHLPPTGSGPMTCSCPAGDRKKPPSSGRLEGHGVGMRPSGMR